MKKIIPVAVLLLIIVFFILHIYVYLGHATSSWFPLQSSASTPFLTENLIVSETIKPDYLHPFRKFEYQYQAHRMDGGYETIIIEQAESIFTSEMKYIKGDKEDIRALIGPNANNQLWRSLATEDYANYLFFITQYLIVLSIIIILSIYYKLNKIR